MLRAGRRSQQGGEEARLGADGGRCSEKRQTAEVMEADDSVATMGASPG